MPTCPEYTVQIKTYDINSPRAYKCMTQAEYDAYRAQDYQQNHASDGMIGFVLLIVFGVAVVGCVVAAVFAFNPYRRKKSQ